MAGAGEQGVQLHPTKSAWKEAKKGEFQRKEIAPSKKIWGVCQHSSNIHLERGERVRTYHTSWQ